MTVSNDTQPNIISYTMTTRCVKVAIFGTIWACFGIAVTYMRRGPLDETRTRGPFRDPAGSAPFRDFGCEVHAWLNVASGSMVPPQQAAALQRG
eukprot:5042331-Pyramimonas_sp.AAC.1